MKTDRKILGAIKQPFGAEAAFTGGLEFDSPIVQVVQSEHYRANPGDLNLRISRELETEQSITLSLETLERIVAWAKGQR